MGLENPKGSIFVSVYNGKITRRWTQAPPDFDEQRTTKLGTAVWEKYYSQLSGYLVNISLQAPPQDHPEYGKSWIFTVADGDDRYKFQVTAKGFTASTILCRLKNVDYSQKIQFRAFPDRNNPSNYVITIMQNEKKVEPWITKEESQGLPQAEVHLVNDEQLWDTSGQLRYYVQMVKDIILPQIFDQNPEAFIEADGGGNETPKTESCESPAGLSTQEELNYEHLTGTGVKREMARDARTKRVPANVDSDPGDESDDLPF